LASHDHPTSYGTENIRNLRRKKKEIVIQMLSCSPSFWPFEDSTSHEQENYMRRDAHPFSSPPPLHFAFFSSPSPHADVVLDHLNIPPAVMNGEAMMVKKLNHNACERDRWKKINSLYSALRSLLPSADQTVILKSFIYKEVIRASLLLPFPG